jgi:hypothetical protein
MARMSLNLAAALTALGLAASASAQPALDHLACYKVKDHATPATYSFSLSGAAGTQNCVAKVPAKVGCFESSESNVVPTPPGGGPSPGSALGAFLCYRTKCKRPFVPTAKMEDQFGARMVVFKGAQFMCAPATRGPIGVAPASTTTTLPPQSCHFADGQCQGQCGAGGVCSAAAQSGSCECRTTPCGQADTPSCDGFCTDPSKACVFNLTGCSCLRIP